MTKPGAWTGWREVPWTVWIVLGLFWFAVLAPFSCR